MNSSNYPPSEIELTTIAVKDLDAWLAEHPVIQSGAEAQEGKLFIDRMKSTLGDLEAERDKQVRPLNKQVLDINAKYREPRRQLTAVYTELVGRLESYAKQETRRREAEAEAKRQAAAAAIRVAEEAQERERDARERVAAGELDISINTIQADAVAAGNAAQRAEREAVRAERESHVRIGGGFKRSISLRQKETLIIQDASAAIKATGITPKIHEAIIAAAREFRGHYNELPPGIISDFKQEL